MGWTCHMACEVRVSLAHRGRAGFVVEILCHGVSPASSSTSHQRQLNGISTRRKLSQTTPPGRLQIAHRCHPRIVRCQRGWHGGARASESVDFWTKYGFCHSVPHQPCSSSQSSLLPSKAMIGHKGHTKAKHALLHSHSKRVNRTESRKAKLETKRTQNQNVPQRQFRT